LYDAARTTKEENHVKRPLLMMLGLSIAASSSIVACSSDSKPAATGFCTVATAYAQRGTEMSQAVDSGDPALLESAVTTMGGQLRKLVESAPAEIATDLTLLDTTYQQFVTVVAGANYDLAALSGTPEAEAILAKLDSSEVNAANSKVEQYISDTCGVTVTS
jgi:hypothetical protein